MATGGLKYPETYLEGMLECSICLEIVDDPHTLQKCLHTVCKACMDQLRAEQNNDPPGVICPVCRKFSEEDMIMGNFFIKDLSQLHKSVKEKKRALCNPCSDKGKSVDATHRCLDCKEGICEDCKAAHQSFKILKGHKIVTLGDDSELVVDQLIFCRIHTDEPIKLYCEPCNALMCMTCKVTKHNTHDSQTIDEALQHIIPEIEKSTKAIDKNIDVLAKSLEELEIKITETKESYEKCYNDVDKTADERIQQIEAARVKIKLGLQAREKEEVEKLVVGFIIG